MPKQRHSNGKNVSSDPILQDFSITSLSEISSGVLNPSDSTIYEEIKGYNVALPNVTLNNTEEINLLSGPYPPDSTMMDISKDATSTPSQVFRKPFFNRQKAKPRQSLFDLDGEDFSQETPEQKNHHPFKRKNKKTLNSTVFDLNSSNENINNSNNISNFITRRTLRSKRNIDNSLFDKALETSESDISVSQKPALLRISKKNSKKVNASVFEAVFDDSLNVLNLNKSDTNNQKQCFNNIKSKQKLVDSALFDSVFNSSASPENSNNVTLEENKEETISECANNSQNISVNTTKSPEISNNITLEENKEESISVCTNTSKNSCINSLKSPEKYNNTTLEENKEQSISVCESMQNSCESSLNLECEISNDSNKTGSKLESCNSECEDNLIKLIDGKNVTSNDEKLIHLVESTNKELELEQIQQHEQLMGNDSTGVNNRCSVPTEKSYAETNFTNELYENHKNNESCNVTLTESQQKVESSVVAFTENKNESYDSSRDLEKSGTNFQNGLPSKDRQTLEETHNISNTSKNLNEHVSTVNTSTLNVNITSNKKQLKNNSINQDLTSNEETLVNDLDNFDNEKQIKTFSTNDAIPKYNEKSGISMYHADQSEKQYSTKEFSSFCELKKDDIKIWYDRDRDIRERNSYGIIGTIATQEITDEDKCTEIISTENLLPIHETTIGNIEITDLVQRDSSFGTQRRTGRLKSLDIVSEASMLSPHEASLTKENHETTSIVEKEASLGLKKSIDRVEYLDIVSEENILPTNNKETKISQVQKDRRVSFMLEENHLNKRVSLNNRRSSRRSILINNSCNSGISSSTAKHSNMSKSAFSLDSLVFEEDSENRISGSAFLDLNATKSASGSLNCNSTFSQQSKPSINASEQDHSYGNSRSSNNDYESQDISEIEPERSATLQKEDELDNSSEMEDNEDVESNLIEEDKSNENSSYEMVEEQFEADHSFEEEGAVDNVEYVSEGESLVEEEKEDEANESTLIEENTLESEEESQFNEISEKEESNQVENSLYEDGEEVEDNSDINSLHRNFETECIKKKKNENSECQTSSNVIKEKKKKSMELRNLFKKPLPKEPISKRKIQEILENIPLSEIKKKKRRVSAQSEKSHSFKSKEQLIQDEIEDALLKKGKTKQVGLTKANKLKIPKKWVTPKMYNFIISKLQPAFGLKARVRAENVVLFLVEHVDSVMKSENNYFDLVEEIKAELAGLEIVHSHWDFYKFATQFFDGRFVDKVYHGEIVNPYEPSDPTESIL